MKWLIDWSRSGTPRARSTAKRVARQALPKPSRLKRRKTPAIVEEAWADELAARVPTPRPDEEIDGTVLHAKLIAK
jgi:hypothetical protein